MGWGTTLIDTLHKVFFIKSTLHGEEINIHTLSGAQFYAFCILGMKHSNLQKIVSKILPEQKAGEVGRLPSTVTGGLAKMVNLFLTCFSQDTDLSVILYSYKLSGAKIRAHISGP